MDRQERFAFIDILKGIAILLIVYGHIIPGTIPYLSEWFSTLNIPLFFFVSGLLFNENKYRYDFGYFVRSRTKGLVVPFIIFSIIVAIGYFFIEHDYASFLVNLFSMGWGGGYALWFIPVLFMVELAYFHISRLKQSQVLFLILTCVPVSYYTSLSMGLVPHNILLTFCGIWFYGLGNLCRGLLKYLPKLQVWHLYMLILLGLTMSFIYFPIGADLPEWFNNKIPSLIFYITPLFAIAGMIGLSLIIEKYVHSTIVTLFVICGKQSFIILAFHQIICMIAQKYMPSKCAIVVMIILLSFAVWFIPRYLPWMLGKVKEKAK